MNKEITTLIYEELHKYGYNIQFGKPTRKNIKFPLIEIREVQQRPMQTKSFLLGRLNVILDLYFPYDDLDEVSEAMQVIPTMVRFFTHPHKWKLNGSNSRLEPQVVGNEDLWHGMLDLEYIYY